MYCFIDWFSTGFIFTNSSQLIYLDTILYKLNQIKCIPIILFLDRNPMEDKRKEMFELVKKYLDQHNINYIDLVQQFDSSKILRDCIHTNSKGSELYGTYIFEKFTNTNSKLNFLNLTKAKNIQTIKIKAILKIHKIVNY